LVYLIEFLPIMGSRTAVDAPHNGIGVLSAVPDFRFSLARILKVAGFHF
jgi:hypothetical protein